MNLDEIRDQYWDFMVDIHFQTIYNNHCCRCLANRLRFLNWGAMALTLLSTLLWSIWSHLIILWLILIVIAQIAQLTTLFLPYSELIFAFKFFIPELECLYIGIEDTWNRSSDFTGEEFLKAIKKHKMAIHKLTKKYITSSSKSIPKINSLCNQSVIENELYMASFDKSTKGE